MGREYNYTVIFEPLPEGGYNVIVPAIPEICPFGDNLEEAREMARDAIRCYLESALERGEPTPQEASALPLTSYRIPFPSRERGELCSSEGRSPSEIPINKRPWLLTPNS